MGKKIPETIKTNLILQYLQGIPRDLIAQNLDIGAGTVTGIIKERYPRIYCGYYST